jgi:hypothetical protein
MNFLLYWPKVLGICLYTSLCLTEDNGIELSTYYLAMGDGIEPSNPFLDQTFFKTVPLAYTVVPPYVLDISTVIC